MRLPDNIEHDLQLVERQLDNHKVMKAGPARLRGLRASIEALVRDHADLSKAFEQSNNRLTEARADVAQAFKAELDAIREHDKEYTALWYREKQERIARDIEVNTLRDRIATDDARLAALRDENARLQRIASAATLDLHPHGVTTAEREAFERGRTDASAKWAKLRAFLSRSDVNMQRAVEIMDVMDAGGRP